MRVRIIASALAAAALSTQSHAQTLVASGHYGGDKFEVFTDSGVSWTTAEANAIGLGGYLATDLNAGENNYIASIDPSGEFWLGGYQDPKNSLSATVATAGWTWVNGQGTFPGVNGANGFTQSFSDWAPGEPNDDYGAGSEQYMAIGLEGKNLWNDEGALGNISGYVVEFSCVPDNNSLLVPMGLTLAGLALAHRRFAKTA